MLIPSCQAMPDTFHACTACRALLPLPPSESFMRGFALPAFSKFVASSGHHQVWNRTSPAYLRITTTEASSLLNEQPTMTQ